MLSTDEIQAAPELIADPTEALIPFTDPRSHLSLHLLRVGICLERYQALHTQGVPDAAERQRAADERLVAIDRELQERERLSDRRLLPLLLMQDRLDLPDDALASALRLLTGLVELLEQRPDPLVVQGLLSMLDKAVVVEVRGNPEYVVKHRLMVDGCVTASLVPNYVAHVSVAKPRPLIESRELAGIVRVHEGLVLGDELHARPRWRLRV